MNQITLTGAVATDPVFRRGSTDPAVIEMASPIRPGGLAVDPSGSSRTLVGQGVSARNVLCP